MATEEAGDYLLQGRRPHSKSRNRFSHQELMKWVIAKIQTKDRKAYSQVSQIQAFNREVF